MKKILFNSIIILGTVLLLQCSSSTSSNPLTLLVPDNYTGQIVILYSQPNTEELKFDDGRLVLMTPENGVIKTSFNPGKTATWNIKCYYVDKNNNKKLLKGYNPNFKDEDEDSDTTSIHFIAEKVGKYGEGTFQSLYIAKPPIVTPEKDKIDSLWQSTLK
jgi:hypothetical protein